MYVGEPGDDQYGCVTCAVAVDHAHRREIYAMSCQHVLSPRGQLRSGLRIAPVLSKDPQLLVFTVAESAGYGGELCIDGRPSFDVQLARVADTSWLRAAVHRLRLSVETPYIMGRDALDYISPGQILEILTPENHPDFVAPYRTPIQGRFSAYKARDFSIPYSIAGLHDVPVFHWQLVELAVIGTAFPRGGDSGAPVVVQRPDGASVLIGMHIAGNPETRRTYLIPAWQLFEPLNYAKLPVGAKLIPVNM